MKTKNASTRKGYTFAEVLMASALLGIVIGGTVKILGTMNNTETTALNGAIAFNMMENAARLWQLGLSPAQIYTVMPSTTDNNLLNNALVPSSGNSVTFGSTTSGSYTMAGSMGTLESNTCSVVGRDPRGVTNRTSTLNIYRPTFR